MPTHLGSLAIRRLPSFRQRFCNLGYLQPDTTSSCDPFSIPGFVSSLDGTSKDTLTPLGVWRTFDQSCPTSSHLPALLSNLEKSPYYSVAGKHSIANSQSTPGLITNKHVLLVGDSVDRSLVENFCWLAGETSKPVDSSHPWGKAALASAQKDPKSSSSQQIAHYCYLPKYNFLLTSMYHYGIDETDAWSKIPNYQGPGLFEDRISQLVLPFLKASANSDLMSNVTPKSRRTHVPDMVFFQSSFWDLALWAQQDIAAGRSAESDLTEMRLLKWRSRNVDMLSHLASKDVFGYETPLLWRSTHYPAEGANPTIEWFTGQDNPDATAAGKPNHPLFRLNRLHQLNEAQLSTLISGGDDYVRGSKSPSARLPDDLAFVPWGQVMLGQAGKQMDPISPSPNPGASIFAEMMLWNLALHKP
ncbi:hypothetical protein K437DRAFT_253749 [Tilletiaria anomala UBC 951]|uniref:Uncharacterized protein n=1 Tax=Tilletiaria anomala (strain ATCC 24038 / CBS 436.72 / UBC 951) TaxID=1037660 RepID=A0A066WGB5_TILAU|nr:uncharacterized protein K437DRAFT_253749 [Tilletiaria anomala UBC 951]KDN52816.1 hypothetical protein K437DRAFT_253749 [Tilletiaria anomala UBC 951]